VKKLLLSDVQRLALFLLTCIAAVFVSHHFLFVPQQQQHAQLTEQLLLKQQKIQSINAFALSHPQLQQYILDLDHQCAYLNKLLPNTLEMQVFINQLQQAAAKSGVQLLKIQPGPCSNRTGYRDTVIELMIRGDYFHTLDFLGKLENNERFTTIDRLSTQANAALLDTKLTVLIFSFGTSPLAAQPEY
jgi:Tfp pilus assembly protein PilO